jgi:predicted metal-binding membrane protein
VMSTLESLLRQDRVAVLASLAGVIAIAWVYLLLGAGIEMDEMDMGVARSWSWHRRGHSAMRR